MLDISNFPWAECSISEARVMYQSDSLSLKRTKRNTGVHRYELELVTIDMDMALGRKIMAKLSAATDDILYFVHPRLGFSMGTEPPTKIQVSTLNLSVGDKSLTLTSIEDWQLMAGDYMQFGNDTKMYQVAEDTLLTSNNQTVKLTSGIRRLPSNGSDVTVNNVGFFLTSNGAIETSMLASDNQDMEMTLVAVEQL